MNFMFDWQEQYLTCSLPSLMRYCSCHENKKFISLSSQVMFFLFHRHTCTGTDDSVFDDFQRFLATFRFSKIFQNHSEGQMNIPQHFLKFSENFQRFSKIAKDF